jgi:hypothetical protein
MKEKMKFKNPDPMNREELLQKFSSGDSDEICDALISMAFYDDDWKWSQDQCLHFLESSDIDVRGIAATCLGHIARIHESLDRELVENALSRHLKDGKISGQVQAALSDIKMFL